MYRMGLAAAIHEMEGIELVGEAQQAEQVAKLAADAAPDVPLLDVRLGEASAWRSTGGSPSTTGGEGHHADDVRGPRHSLTALRDGASGYLVKGAGPQRRARPADGRRRRRSISPWPRPSPSLAQVRRAATSRRSPSSPSASSTSSDSSPRGLDNHTIARRLVLSLKTVRNHVSNVFAKIQATDRPHAIVLARRLGLTPTVGTVGVMPPDATDVRATIKPDRRPRRASTPGATTASASSSSRCTTRPTRRSGTA